MRKLFFAFSVAVLATAVLATATPASSPTVTLTIRHQTRGCHTWGVTGSRFAATQRLRMTPGSVLRVVNSDVMPHRLVKTSGPQVRIAKAQMGHMMAAATVRFTHRGVYKFTTKAGEDYPNMGHMRTVGEDFVLRLTVVVS